MAKAKSVHSTPRRTASKIKPGAPANTYADAVRNEALARAFISLEPALCNLDRMARLCGHLSDDGAEEFLTLCVERLEEMAGEFRKQYYAMYGSRDSASADGKAVS
jgi:hypothetical protein